MLRVRLLGDLRAEAAEAPVEPPASRRAWALLGWLALHPGDHLRSSLAARFWPDVLDASARASLRSATWALRRALGPAADALVAGRDRLGLRCETDLARFEAHLAAGELEAAVALATGPLLADLDEDWVLEARDAHAERLAAALARLAAGAATPAAAVGWARRRLAVDPLDEEAARDLMRRLAAAGDRAGALAVHDRLGERLRTGLGLAPSRETRALRAAILSQAADEAPDDVPAREADAHDGVAVQRRAADSGDGVAAPRRAGDARGSDAADGVAFVGRAAELDELLELWERARAGHGALAVLGGEGGIGKSRLAAELLTRARAAGARTAACGALDLGVPPPFGLWAELLSGLARELVAPPPDVSWPEELARLAPALPRRLGRAPAAPADVPPELARTRLFEAAVELAEHATADRPLVLLFDDVHLADGPSLELAAYLARRIAGLPVVLVLTRRATPRRDEVDTLVHAARARGVAATELVLAPLARPEVERLVADVAGLDAVGRDRVVTVADGNPLLALESARAAARGDTGPPGSLRAAVRAAVAPLSAPARRTTELAAVAGRDLGRAELVAVAEPDAVLAAMDCGLLRSEDGRLGFRHALLREAVYADLDDARRRVLHERLGEALAARPAEAARHLRLAGRDDLAAVRLMEAAAEAVHATAFEDAARFLSEAAALRPRDPAPRLELAEIAAVLGRRETAETALREALERCAPADRAAVHLRASVWYRSSLCDPAAAGTAAAAGLAALDPRAADDVEVRAELLSVRAWSEVTIGGADAADGTLRALDALGRDAARTPLQRAEQDIVRAFVHLARGRPRDAERRLAACGEVAGRGHPELAYGSFGHAACVAAADHRLQDALAYAERGMAITSGLPAVEFEMLGIRAYVLARLARHAEARADTDRQVELAERLDSPRMRAQAAHDAGLLALMAGDHERAAVLLARALAGDAPVQRAEARLRRAEALARLGQADAADAEIRAATGESVRPSHRPAVLVARMAFAQALSARARGDAALAEARLREAARHWERLRGADAAWARVHLAALVDLGRAPVAGVVDPEGELERIATELDTLHAAEVA